MFGWTKNSQRRKLLKATVSDEESAQLHRALWQSTLLTVEEQSQLVRWTRIFIQEKNWEGCDGLEVTDEIKQAVAAAAGLMVMHHPEWYFDHTQSILIYPRPYVAKVVPKYQALGLWGEYARAGETIYRGPVVLNWEDIRRAAKLHNRGHHLVIHEFAHQLDMINGPNADGLPPLPGNIDEDAWRIAMIGEYDAARSMVEQGHRIFINDYGLTDVGEFFAVASELYFQLPNELAEFHPNVFQLLKQFYAIDFRDREGQ
ncbi:MAG: M90 family metallopeptidase [Pirellulaceae bacterium]|nr:M90 family metallopeptidase [Pirellulaceae bacterium]